MTLNDIIVAALAQLDRGHDAQSLDTWRDKFTRFANEAVLDLCGQYQPRRTEDIKIEKGLFNVALLSHECIKVYAIEQGGKPLRFSGMDTGMLAVGGSGAAQATYRFVPAILTSPTDVPEVPGWMHGLIVCYVVARERAAGDVGLQRGGNVYFQMYEAGKRGIRPHLGDTDSYRIVNRW